jgi:hypothetical protein
MIFTSTLEQQYYAHLELEEIDITNHFPLISLEVISEVNIHPNYGLLAICFHESSLSPLEIDICEQIASVTIVVCQNRCLEDSVCFEQARCFSYIVRSDNIELHWYYKTRIDADLYKLLRPTKKTLSWKKVGF